MKVSYSWIKDYTDIDADIKSFCDEMTMSGSKVEEWKVIGGDISNVVAGKILSIEKHPDADKLVVCKVDVGNGEIQIVTGATNVSEGDLVPVALHGASLPGGVKIKKGKLRGVVSDGMLCSLRELNLTVNDYPNAIEDGIFILDRYIEPGTDMVHELGLDENIIEFEITSNRPDCFSVIGLAREAAATFKREFTVKEPMPAETGNGNAADMVSIEIADKELCPRYTGRVITDVVIEPSPEWLRKRLRDAGIRPINNIVDITNYVLLEYGQPMHAFDLDNLRGGKIIVRRAMDGEEIETLDDQPRKLDPAMLVIADEERPVAVAGVMGGADSEVTGTTKRILFESANFNMTSIRLTAQKLSMRTESSGRFEKGLDMKNTLPAINRACELVEELGAGRVVPGIIDVHSDIPEKKRILLRPDKINAFLGTDISRDEMVTIFRPLEIEMDGDYAVVPSFRPDLVSEADLAEEVARFYGYNNIAATMPAGDGSTQGKRSYEQGLRDMVENVCLSAGLYEVYTYSFTSPSVFDKLRLPPDSPLRKTVVIRRPLGEDYSVMRTTTLPEMMKVISHNSNRSISGGGFYEMSFTYHPIEGEELPEQRTVLTMGLYGSHDFFDMKGIAMNIFETLGIGRTEYVPVTDNPTFHPGRCAAVVVDGNTVAVFGQVHPETAENFEVPGDTLLLEMNIDMVYKLADLDRKYRELPRYPAVSRDIAVVVDEDITSARLISIIRESAGNNLEEVEFFDMYKGSQIGEGKKSLAFSMTYRSADRTLTEEEVNASFDKVLKALAEKTGAILR
ncbi:MAG TPA: phenylalanine--tRNA ligase subunit beta [Clostridia bacterium]|nr:phenylalanine--tRNA ligase subunit beta [Clostridia bacterium]